MICLTCFFFFKQKSAYERRISDWSSDVCSSDLVAIFEAVDGIMGEEVADAEGGRPGAVDVVLIEQKTIPRRIGRGTEKVLRHGVPTRLRLPEIGRAHV